MPIFSRFFLRLRWLNPAVGALVVLLQRTPVVRLLITAESELSSPATNLLRAIVPLAALGVVDSMAGASTQLAYSSVTAKPTVGQPFSAGIVITGSGVSYAQSWKIANTLPPGVTPQGATLSGNVWSINPSSGTLVLSGTPTTAGTYSVSISGYQYTNFGTPVTSATATIVVAAAPNAAPVVTRAPSDITTIAGASATFSVNYTGNPLPTYQWLKNGTAIAGATGATLVIASVAASDAGSYSVTLTNSLGTTTSSPGTLTVNPAPTAPSFSVSPQSLTVTAGGNVTLSVTVSGVPTPSLQWLKNGAGIDGAFGTTLTLSSVQIADAGTYSVTASNSVGFATSAVGTLVVNAATSAPVFVSPPVSQTIATGSTVVFSAPALGTPAPTYQWLFNGATIVGATDSTLVIKSATAANAGAYTCVAQNSLGLASSPAAGLTVNTVAASSVGRLINLSILTTAGAGAKTLTVGCVIGPNGTSGGFPIVVRAVGPTLTTLGVGGVLPDPILSVNSSSSPPPIATNDDWGGSTAMSSAFASVGAFALPANSLDSAYVPPSPGLTLGNYTIVITGKGNATGTVLAEVYDASAATRTPSSPRLINLSTLTQIDPGGLLTVGFVLGGTTARTVLVRGVGPSLGAAPFNIPTAMVDPKLDLFDGSSQKIAGNDDWGGSTPIVNTAASVGAFKLASAATKDSVLLVTLAPGNYSVQMSGADGGGGTAIVEIYEVP